MISDKLSNRLNDAVRFSGFPLESPETVSQHVAAMEMLHVELYNLILKKLPDVKYDRGEVAWRISIHDLDEAAMGDIPRPVKYFDSEMLYHFNRVATATLKDNYHETIVDSVETAKDSDTIYGVIVNLLDSLQCVIRLKISRGFNKRYTKMLVESAEILQKKIEEIDYSVYSEDEQSILKLIVGEMQDELLHYKET